MIQEGKHPQKFQRIRLSFEYAAGRYEGRHQNLNPDSKISLNHANLNLVNLWVVVSQEFHTQFQLLGLSSSFTFQCRSCAQADFVTVVAWAGWAGVADGPHRRGDHSMLSRMVCGAGRWLRAVALKIRCAGEHVLVSTNRLRTMCWLVVVGDAGGLRPRVASLLRDGVVSRESVRRCFAQRCGQGRSLPREN